MRASNCPKAFQPCLLPGGCGRNAFGSAEGVTAIDTVDADFRPDMKGLTRAIDLLNDSRFESAGSMPEELPSAGLGCSAALEALAPLVIGGAARLDAPHMLSNMDPPTPWIAWATTLWNARLNQNLLHPSTAPFARQAEALVIKWLAPYFGMLGGHTTPGSTVANLTGLWAARDAAGAKRVVASSASHLSIKKSARILGMTYEEVPVDGCQRLRADAVPDLTDACLVLTAGTTAAGAVDDLALAGAAAWTHVDAAWAGPLRLSSKHSTLLMGIDEADSIAISAHKWLFQPKDSGIVLFRDVERANEALSFAGGYLAAPNVGVLGSHGAVAVPLLATLLAWGRNGVSERIDRCMANAERLSTAIDDHDGYRLLLKPQTGVVLFESLEAGAQQLLRALPAGLASIAIIGGKPFLRCVAANPVADIGLIIDNLDAAAHLAIRCRAD